MSSPFLRDLQRKGEPHATRVVRTISGIGLRDAEVDVVDLPSCYTKRQLYARFLHEIGWIVRPKVNGSFGKIADYEQRPFDEFWIEGEDVPTPACSFETFRAFWAKNFPKLKIRSPVYNTCSLCYQYSNNLSDIQRKMNGMNVFLEQNELSRDETQFDDDEESIDEDLVDILATTEDN